MYIRIKIFDSKNNTGNHNFCKPLYFLEANGNNAIITAIMQTIKYFYGKEKAEKIKKELENIEKILKMEE